ncbi:MAG: fused MFS/spermidine synthase [Desulfarculaceae bacterium]|nr:fused MFS/spermidine synthase [Desulfarculaceae bacterium]MCF8072962.1 fused MFS/spermidine synthase [Desulfarculaceae bacterium]MCF8100742.1 fused MFS/spermidine synthase [Desulfarculaceae bacterium]MCF8115480.1 fused MFS/spermidine synthase [Desulfarculaceae bacterium]
MSFTENNLKKIFIITAILEGASVLVVEIAGARALAPFYGTSLYVWTAQITATLLFLALGYGLGGRLSLGNAPRSLAVVFSLAGFWLILFPLLRTVVLNISSGLGVSLGSFTASIILFGLPLLCLGAVSPLLIQQLDRLKSGAGSAAGTLFFTNTLGGIAGGWLTALVLIPYLPLRLALAGTGFLLMAIGIFLGIGLKSAKPINLGVLTAVAFFLFLISPGPLRTLQGMGTTSTVLFSKQSGVGLVQVFEVTRKNSSNSMRNLLIDGIAQGGIIMGNDHYVSCYAYPEYMNFLGHQFHPNARRALVLGLGCGVIATQLERRGLDTTVVELEPAVEEAARKYFMLPSDVKVIIEDGRAWLNYHKEKFDLVFLDTFAGENMPWYLFTKQALEKIKGILTPEGRLIVNSVTHMNGESPGLAMIETGLLQVFGEAKVFVEKRAMKDGNDLVNAVLVAGKNLKMEEQPVFSSMFSPRIKTKIWGLIKWEGRDARSVGVVSQDDFSSLDYVDAPLRLDMRRLILQNLDARMATN